MMCYRDRTYCQYYMICKKYKDSCNALTIKVRKDANDLGFPICQYDGYPNCFEALWSEDE